MKRTKDVEEKYGGQCNGTDTIIDSCPDINITCPRGCVWGEWNNNGTWSECSVTCAKGTKRRYRNITSEPEPGGKECSDLDSFQTTECTENPCPGDNIKTIDFTFETIKNFSMILLLML